MNIIKFTKVHGLGNDFVIFDLIKENKNIVVKNENEIAKHICDRNKGIGADGLVILEKANNADINMRIFNPDGSEAEMCGNAIRCVAMYAFNRKIIHNKIFTVSTGAGILTPEIIEVNDSYALVKVDMGEPLLHPKKIPVNLDGENVVAQEVECGDKVFKITCVSMGNPHCVIFAPEITTELIEKYGPLMEKHEIFPRKTNVEFAKVKGEKQIEMKVWERGAGQTLACGTGACATLVASVLNGLTSREATINLAGGDLIIEWSESGKVYMTGPAEEAFVGEIKL